MATALIAALLAIATWLLGHGRVLPVSACIGTMLIAVGARLGVDLVHQAGERRRLRRAFAGYVSPPVLEEILDGRLQPGLGGERRRVCLLFSDIRGFTTLSESMPPEQVIQLLNRYFGEWTAAIQGRQGTLDKFIGDGVMAFFGAPKPSPSPCRNAFDAARDMLDRARDASLERMDDRGAGPVSKEEIKKELKETEGDQILKIRRRTMARNLARRRMLLAVGDADVVVTNPTHIAVALKYDPEVASAPLVLAMGVRKVAAQIKTLAMDSGVPVVENKPLARALYKTARVGLPIPVELYVAVAEILAWVIQQRERLKTAWKGTSLA